MKTPLVLLILIPLTSVRICATDFSRETAFGSIDEFVTMANQLRPKEDAGSGIGALFTLPEMGEDEKGTPVMAAGVHEAQRIWENEDAALVFVTAEPPTRATRSQVGVLFFIQRKEARWRVSDLVRFTATGKYAGLSAELTAGANAGNALNADRPPVVRSKNRKVGGATPGRFRFPIRLWHRSWSAWTRSNTTVKKWRL